MIEARDVVFEYPGHRALDGVSFSLPASSITALVGPNGAGKSTLLRCLAALDEPLAGSIEVAGIDVRNDPRACHRKVGYLSDFFGLYDELAARRCLEHAARLHEAPASEIPARIQETAEFLQLEQHLDKRASELSRGLRQRLAIAQAIIHRPEVVLLDEPASGLDPDARHELSTLFLRLRDMGMTLVVSSHILAELDEYSSHMLILRDGKILEHRSLADSDPETVLLEVVFAAASDSWSEALASTPGLRELSVSDRTARFRYDPAPDARAALLRRFVEAGLGVVSFAEARKNLQEVYREEVRRERPAAAETEEASE